MVELELEVNQRAWEWGALQESSSSLQPTHGARLTGILNLGNSCYLNSVMQVLLPYTLLLHFATAPSLCYSSTGSGSWNSNGVFKKNC